MTTLALVEFSLQVSDSGAGCYSSTVKCFYESHKSDWNSRLYFIWKRQSTSNKGLHGSITKQCGNGHYIRTKTNSPKLLNGMGFNGWKKINFFLLCPNFSCPFAEKYFIPGNEGLKTDLCWGDATCCAVWEFVHAASSAYIVSCFIHRADSARSVLHVLSVLIRRRTTHTRTHSHLHGPNYLSSTQSIYNPIKIPTGLQQTNRQGLPTKAFAFKSHLYILHKSLR